MAIKTGNNNDNNIIDIEVKEDNTAVAVEAPEVDGTISLAKVDEIRNENTMLAIRDKVKTELIASGKMDLLTSQISLDDQQTILNFGKEPALYMATISDQIIKSYDPNTINNIGSIVDSLMKLFKEIDISEIKTLEQLKQEREKKGFLGKMFDKVKETAEEKLARLTKKYNRISGEIENLCTQLKVYEATIEKTNKDINKMYDASVQQYTELQEYIAAGDQAVAEIRAYKEQKEKEAQESGDQSMQLEVRSISNSLDLMEKRLVDLRASEAIALQGIPTYKIQEYTNSNISRKIQSAFIVTIPAFKNSITALITAKQQMLANQGLSVLDEAAREFYKMGAQNTVNSMLASQEAVNNTPISAEDIETNWGIIMDGIKQYKANEEAYRKIREEEVKKIDAANEKFSKELASGAVL